MSNRRPELVRVTIAKRQHSSHCPAPRRPRTTSLPLQMHSPGFHFIVALDPHGRVAMTRDMELIRKIVVAIQSRTDTEPRGVTIPGEEEWRVVRHLELLHEAGLIDALVNRPTMGPSLPKFAVKDLTMAGHDFAAAIENEPVWSQIKKSFSPAEFAKLSLKAVLSIGTDLGIKWARSKVGL